jgi:hypothetical protein
MTMRMVLLDIGCLEGSEGALSDPDRELHWSMSARVVPGRARREALAVHAASSESVDRLLLQDVQVYEEE